MRPCLAELLSLLSLSLLSLSLSLSFSISLSVCLSTSLCPPLSLCCWLDLLHSTPKTFNPVSMRILNQKRPRLWGQNPPVHTAVCPAAVGVLAHDAWGLWLILACQKLAVAACLLPAKLLIAAGLWWLQKLIVLLRLTCLVLGCVEALISC